MQEALRQPLSLPGHLCVVSGGDGSFSLGTLSVLGPREPEACEERAQSLGSLVVTCSAESGPSKTSVLELEHREGRGCLPDDQIPGPLPPFFPRWHLTPLFGAVVVVWQGLWAQAGVSALAAALPGCVP